MIEPSKEIFGAGDTGYVPSDGRPETPTFLDIITLIEKKHEELKDCPGATHLLNELTAIVEKCAKEFNDLESKISVDIGNLYDKLCTLSPKSLQENQEIALAAISELKLAFLRAQAEEIEAKPGKNLRKATKEDVSHPKTAKLPTYGVSAVRFDNATKIFTAFE